MYVFETTILVQLYSDISSHEVALVNEAPINEQSRQSNLLG